MVYNMPDLNGLSKFTRNPPEKFFLIHSDTDLTSVCSLLCLLGSVTHKPNWNHMLFPPVTNLSSSLGCFFLLLFCVFLMNVLRDIRICNLTTSDCSSLSAQICCPCSLLFLLSLPICQSHCILMSYTCTHTTFP